MVILSNESFMSPWPIGPAELTSRAGYFKSRLAESGLTTTSGTTVDDKYVSDTSVCVLPSTFLAFVTYTLL